MYFAVTSFTKSITDTGDSRKNRRMGGDSRIYIRQAAQSAIGEIKFLRSYRISGVRKP